MPLKLIPPGARKGNPSYLARGTVAGVLFERSLGTAKKRECEIIETEGGFMAFESAKDAEIWENQK